jgi:putative tryptophan/tyrosine transport system substrate-binding protein
MQSDRIRRREVITLIGGAAGWSLAAHAQQANRIRRIGIFFGGFSESDPEPRRRIAAFARSLQEVGWIDGRNQSPDRAANRGRRC